VPLISNHFGLDTFTDRAQIQQKEKEMETTNVNMADDKDETRRD